MNFKRQSKNIIKVAITQPKKVIEGRLSSRQNKSSEVTANPVGSLPSESTMSTDGVSSLKPTSNQRGCE